MNSHGTGSATHTRFIHFYSDVMYKELGSVLFKIVSVVFFHRICTLIFQELILMLKKVLRSYDNKEDEHQL